MESSQSVGHYPFPVYQSVGSILSVADHAEESSDYSWMKFVVAICVQKNSIVYVKYLQVCIIAKVEMNHVDIIMLPISTCFWK